MNSTNLKKMEKQLINQVNKFGKVDASETRIEYIMKQSSGETSLSSYLDKLCKRECLKWDRVKLDQKDLFYFIHIEKL